MSLLKLLYWVRQTPQQLVLGLLLAGGLGCQPAPRQTPTPSVSDTAPSGPRPTPPARRGSVASGASAAKLLPASSKRGADLVRRFECARCHEGTDTPPSPRDKHCVQCHQEILTGRFDAASAVLADWQRNIKSLTQVPELEHTGQLIRSDWLVEYLLDPNDLRPGLLATMPRLPLSRQQAIDIAAYLVRDSPPATLDQWPREGNRERGRSLFESRGCGNCHAFERPASSVPSAPSTQLAPDLRWTRQRVRPDRIMQWLLDPNQVKPGTLMPNLGLSQGEARDLAVYLVRTPLKPSRAQLPARLPPLTRDVSYAEVEREVFKKTCWHCHAQPDLARGDGGPGMTGGFGFRARALDLSSYSSLLAGYRSTEGQRVSAFRPSADGEPTLLATLLARQREEVGKPGELRGMPLGLPALTPGQIQLVESWIVQGRPQ